MKTLLLCGGTGKRMAPLTEDKFLFNFLGKTLLEHQFEMLVKAGLNDVILVCNPQNQQKVTEILKHTPVKASVVIQETPKGIADALECAFSLFDDELLIINPNDLFELRALTSLIETRCRSAAKGFMVGHVVREYFPGGYLVTDEKGNLSHIVEKPGRGNEPSNLVNLLVHWHTEPAVLMDYIHHVRTDRDDVYEQAIDAMCKDNHEIRVVPYTGDWHAVKYPWNLFDFVHLFLNRSDSFISPTAQISERAVIKGKVIIEDGVRIMGNAVVNGPVYLGRGTVVGNYALVGDYSHIGANCVIGFASEIKGSYVENGCRFYMNRIGDSIIGDRCNFGAGTHTVNQRSDGQTVRVGIGNDLIDSGKAKLGAIIGSDCQFGPDVRILPGIKIATGSRIRPAASVTEDIIPKTSPPDTAFNADKLPAQPVPVLQTV
jgi:UDP-N-acetylglucosamine diphosphorylase / glucose-1-phosphate thymidylyltransferase / UDP-N-acetylgalactosamine diphosphorylase / glucosamine-1-phosphate N-acetyltransferase / galactosamine-1-phosphate N-acetyltransferase